LPTSPTGLDYYIVFFKSSSTRNDEGPVWFALAPGFIHSIPVAQWFPFILDELSNWVLFLILVYLFSLALPAWAKAVVLSPLRAYVRR
jgi:hypothetical protein